MNFILNIGLKSETLGDISLLLAKQMLWAADLMIVKEAVHTSDTEPTLVVEVSTLNGPSLTLAQFRNLAIDLGQDCIAIYRPKTGKGALIGPKAAAWGPFNPEYFIQLDGTRLAAPAQLAA